MTGLRESTCTVSASLSFNKNVCFFCVCFLFQSLHLVLRVFCALDVEWNFCRNFVKLLCVIYTRNGLICVYSLHACTKQKILCVLLFFFSRVVAFHSLWN